MLSLYKVKYVRSISALALSVLAASAQAAVTFSDVTYTSTSLTFTATGDLAGVTNPNNPNHIEDIQLNIYYTGDIYTGAFSWNIWSRGAFANRTMTDIGNTYKWFSDSPAYTWSWYNPSLVGAVFNAGPTTVSWTTDILNPNGNGTINFIWGWAGAFSAAEQYRLPVTVLATADVVQGNVVGITNNFPGGNVPEPATIALMALGFAGMGYLQRRKSLQA